jgi:hypothetical protein
MMTAPKIISDDVLHVPHVFTFSQGTWKECICLVAAPTKPKERSGRQTGRDKTHAEQHDMFDSGNSRASQGTRP